MVLTQTAVDREQLLVPAPVPAPDAGTGRRADAPATVVVGSAPQSPAVAAPAEELATSWGAVRIAQVGLAVLAVLALGLAVELALVSRLEERSAQVSALNSFRTHLALGTAPLGPVGPDHHLLPLGTPMALVTIPAIGVRAVVLEGTTGAVLAKGPGHVRTSVFPGGAGASVLLGRAGLYGGPFGRIGDLARGDIITVATQVGTSRFRVVRIRPAGATVRPPAAGTARLTLGTATGGFLTPSGVLWVDADKIGHPLASTPPSGIVLLPAEAPLATDASTLWALVLWLEALGILLGLGVWTWRRWGRAQALIVFTAPMLLAGLFAADQAARLLPNLM